MFGGTEDPRGPGFLFLDRTDQGTPTRWDPCEPIHYVVNAELAPPGSIEDVHEAVRRVSAATGMRFVYEGTTDEEASISRDVYQFDRYGDRWVPVLIAWVDPDVSDIPFERGDRVAAGVAVPRIAPTRLEDVYVSGWVAINADDPNPPGFSVPGQQGPVMLHELGHLMGLGHVRAAGELMHPSGGGVVDFGQEIARASPTRRRRWLHPGLGPDRPVMRVGRQRGCTVGERNSTLPGWDRSTRVLHLRMVRTREAGTVGAMIPDRICCPA